MPVYMLRRLLVTGRMDVGSENPQDEQGESHKPPVDPLPDMLPLEHEVEISTKEEALKLAKFYSDEYHVGIRVNFGVDDGGVNVNPRVLKPTQGALIKDELAFRAAQIADGTSEPLILLRAQRFGNNTLYILDGHHRWVEASKKGINKIKAYILEPETPFELNLADHMNGIESPQQLRILDHKSRGTKH
ncbi:MAG: ParB/RepB/Spo0J family partition protein [Candidatus Altiarchaeota archaeon]|nr:ParB/RepB/Spo0J family partition protein [Candidatus Altiarchaeota archaeon]